MGDRAVITTEDKDLGLYLHWDGERRYVDGFLAFCKAMDYRPPEDDDYGWARLSQTVMNCGNLMKLCQIVSNWFGEDGCSVGINKYSELDTKNGDNGVYVISDWKIVKRMYNYGEGTKVISESDLIDMLRAINERQPAHSQLSDDAIIKAAKDYIAQYDEDVK